jgi:hypothetical protein
MTMKALLKQHPKNSGVEFKVWIPYDTPFRGRTHHNISFKGLVHQDIADLIVMIPTDEGVRQALLKLAADIKAKAKPAL